MQECEEKKLVLETCHKLENAAMHIFASFGYPFISGNELSQFCLINSFGLFSCGVFSKVV